MNYRKLHDQIIFNARSQDRQKGNEIYYEEHHIVLRSEGGWDNAENKVLLTAREHFIIHWILTKIYPANYNMIYALNAFEWPNKDKQRKGGRSILYQYARLKYVDMLKHNEEWKQKVSKTVSKMIWVKNEELGLCSRIRKDSLQEYLDHGFTKGRITFTKSPLSEESKKKISEATRGKTISRGHRDKISKKCKDSIWITKDGEDRMIQKSEDLQSYLDSGWIRGRSKGEFGKNKDKVWIHKDDQRKVINSEDLNRYLKNGWTKGNGIPGRKDVDFGKCTKNTLWINDGVQDKRVSLDKFEILSNSVWMKGRLKSSNIGNNQFKKRKV